MSLLVGLEGAFALVLEAGEGREPTAEATSLRMRSIVRIKKRSKRSLLVVLERTSRSS
jgi:hypothetical protein